MKNPMSKTQNKNSFQIKVGHIHSRLAKLIIYTINRNEMIYWKEKKTPNINMFFFLIFGGFGLECKQNIKEEKKLGTVYS